MADEGLGREQVARLGRGVARAQVPQRGDLGPVADGGPRAVGLDHGHGARGHPGVGVGGPQRGELPVDARCHRAGGAAVVGDADATDHRVHPVAVGQRVREGAQDGDPAALAENEPVGALVEGAAHPARRERPHPGEGDQRVRGQVEEDPADQGDPAHSGAQREDRFMQRHRHGRAGGVDGERGTAEIEHAADRPGRHVEQAARQGVRLQWGDARVRGPLDRGEQVRIGFAAVQRTVREQARPHPGAGQLPIVGLADAHVDAGTRPVERAAFQARVLERLTGEVDQQPLLRVHRPGAPRWDPIVRCREPVDVVDEGDPVGIGPMRASWIQRVVEGPVNPSAVRHLVKLWIRFLDQAPEFA